MRILDRVRGRTGDDRGVTLAEMVVTTGILSVVMAIFTTAVVQLFQASNENTAVAVSQAQLNTAFTRLDRELRYAAGFSRENSTGDTVEYVNTETSTGTAECAQLNLDATGRTLRRQVWKQGTKPGGRWAVLASDIDVAQSSFKLLAPDATAGFQRLQVVLVVTTAPGRGKTTARSRITFTALNTTSGTDPKDVCPEARTTT
ncbi:prepilin-type N-terminal cleavage/methylation domain-containing protein [Dactylosporangium sp. AC04546]|uniref:prepilin-type N-terminal cleavage/methylation domain-containing protein n=1 Tax=Dactylosporangium sp. AC04546 TaxID=2862460 RepID=UPI001EDD35CB|nr:prepilin-type N-terminal cleavage/methylation domain-containing protein [Dactylosporangium sp. AC04546]WVK82427.1 prepilin-type N-terminal cleavage/methylation domain-containing protein [Dactylosporangium sp. AC04546]